MSTPTIERPAAEPTSPDRGGPGRWAGARRLLRYGTPLQIAFLVLAAYLVLRPLAIVFWGALRSDDPGAPGSTYSIEPLRSTYTELVTGGTFFEAVLNSLILCALVAVLSLLIGGVLAWLLARTDLPGKGVLRFLVLTPIFYSTLVSIIGWEFLFADQSGLVNAMWRDLTGAESPLYGIYSHSGVVLVMVLHFVPYVVLIAMGPMQAMDGSMEEAAEMAGASRWNVLRTVTLPILMPGLAASALVVFVLALEMFSAPLVLGSRDRLQTLAGWIYLNVRGLHPDLPMAAAGGTVLLLIIAVAVWCYRRLSRRTGRFVTVGRGFRPTTVALGRARPWVTGVAYTFAVVTAVLPLIGVLLRSLMTVRNVSLSESVFSLGEYRTLFADAATWEALKNTLILSTVGGVICVVIGLMVALWKARRPTVTVRLVDYVVTLPVAVPGILIGLGFLWAFVASPLYLTLTLILIVMVARFMGIAVQATYAGVSQLDRSMEEASGVFGATPAGTVRTITAPLLGPVMVSVWLLVFLDIARELSASVLLYGVGSRTLPILTWSLLEDGVYGRAAALSLVQVVLIGLVMFFLRAFLRNDPTTLSGKG